MLETTTVTITRHAMLRYRERIAPGATREQVIAHLSNAGRIGPKTRNLIKSMCPYHKKLVRTSMLETDYVYLGDRECLFVIKVTGHQTWALLTVLPNTRGKRD